MQWLPIYPPQASSIAGQVDSLALFMLVVSLLIAFSIFMLIIVFCVKYRRRPGNEFGQPDRHTTPVEVTWTLIPLALCMIPFVWGAHIYLDMAQPPANSLEVFVVAKQWIWKTEQPGGQEEINALHVPTGQPVKLTMTSQDVIHSFFVPAFRVKADVLPGRYTTVWFTATQPGDYMLFCSQYCGTDHAAMTGHVTAMTPGDYATWLDQSTAFQSPAAQGRKLFMQYGCADCHEANRAPSLQGLYGQPVLLSDGSTVVADDAYIRQKLLTPAASIPAGYAPIMPSFSGQLSEEDILNLIAYIRSIGASPLNAVPAPQPVLPVPSVEVAYPSPAPAASPSPIVGGGANP